MAALGFLAHGASLAIPALNRLYTQRQPDGTVLSYRLVGDEHFHYYATADSLVLARNAAGALCYARVENGTLVATATLAHNAAERSADERALTTGQTLLRRGDSRMTALVKSARTASMTANAKGAFRSMRASSTDGLGTYGKSARGDVPSVGNISIPVVMVQFADRKFEATTTEEKLTRYFNEAGYHDEPGCVGSVKDYFTSSSNGLFIPTFVVVGKVTLSRGYAYYGKDSQQKDGNVISMVREAVDSIVAQGIDFTPYAVNGELPLISFFYAGQGQATGGGDDTIWPHEFSLKSYRYWYPTYSVKAGDYYVNSYFVGNELNSKGALMGMGVFCHEFTHALGFPDVYSTDENDGTVNNNKAMDYFSIMDTGAYWPNGTANAPVGYTAYEKSFMGWLKMQELGTVTDDITMKNPSTDGTGYAAFFRNPSDKKEYFILENRPASTWYPAAIAGGVMLTHVAYDANSWDYNTVNTGQRRYFIVTADGAKLSAGRGSKSNLFGIKVSNVQSFTYYNNETDHNRSFRNITTYDDGTATAEYHVGKYVPTTGRMLVKVGDLADLNTTEGDTVAVVCTNEAMALTTTPYNDGLAAADVAVQCDSVLADENTTLFLLKKVGSHYVLNGNRLYLQAATQGSKLSTASRYGTNVQLDLTFEEGNAYIDFVKPKDNNRLVYHPSTAFFDLDSTSDGVAVQLYRLPKTPTTAIREIGQGGNGQARVTYYTLDGRKVNGEYHGVMIRRSVDSDGSVKTVKVVRQ